MSDATPEQLTLRTIYLSPKQALREDDLLRIYRNLTHDAPRLRYLKLVELVTENSGVYRLTREGRAIAIKTELDAGIDQLIIDQTTKLPLPDETLLAKLGRLIFGDGNTI